MFYLLQQIMHVSIIDKETIWIVIRSQDLS